jgi:hypothetical protein
VTKAGARGAYGDGGIRELESRIGMKTGDEISPPGGYAEGARQMQTDLAISPAGDAGW